MMERMLGSDSGDGAAVKAGEAPRVVALGRLGQIPDTSAGAVAPLRFGEVSTTVPVVKTLDALARLPRAWIWVGAFLILAALALIDFVTPWKFSLFMFYAFAIFGVAWSLGLRAAIGFAAGCLCVSWFANVDSYPFADLRGFAWSAANRSVGFLFVAACGNAIRGYREEAVARVAALQRTRQLEQEIVRTSEAEHRRIGQDLHDGACQSLAAIDCAAELLKRALEAEGVGHVADAEQIQRLLRETNTELRHLARAMSPVNLTGEGLPDAIRALVATTNQLRRSTITFLADEEIRISDPDTAIHLYRIAQEALSNAMKHAHATRVGVTLKRTHGGLTLTVTDDGRGLPAHIEASDGMGLHTMEYRAHLIGAMLRVANGGNGGVSVSCVLPERGISILAEETTAGAAARETFAEAVS